VSKNSQTGMYLPLFSATVLNLEKPFVCYMQAKAKNMSLSRLSNLTSKTQMKDTLVVLVEKRKTYHCHQCKSQLAI